MILSYPLNTQCSSCYGSVSLGTTALCSPQKQHCLGAHVILHPYNHRERKDCVLRGPTMGLATSHVFGTVLLPSHVDWLYNSKLSALMCLCSFHCLLCCWLCLDFPCSRGNVVKLFHLHWTHPLSSGSRSSGGHHLTHSRSGLLLSVYGEDRRVTP